jgi:hypothetical protein
MQYYVTVLEIVLQVMNNNIFRNEFSKNTFIKPYVLVVYLTNELNTIFFCSTSSLKAPNRLKSLKLA